MVNFESVQQALGYIFDNKPLIVINIPNSKYNWFLVDEIRNILEYNMDNYAFTKNLEFRDQVIAVLNLSNFREIGTHHMNDMVSSYLKQLATNTPTVMIISEPGLYELLVKSRMSKAKPFREWLFFTVLPTLRANPELVQQINDLSKQIDDLTFTKDSLSKMAIGYRDESIRQRKIARDLRRDLSNLEEDYGMLEDDNYSLNKRIMNLQDELNQYENPDPYSLKFFN